MPVNVKPCCARHFDREVLTEEREAEHPWAWAVLRRFSHSKIPFSLATFLDYATRPEAATPLGPAEAKAMIEAAVAWGWLTANGPGAWMGPKKAK